MVDRKIAGGYPVISIIVCVFNAELTLKRCIDSILSQTYNQIEIVLVDDGSTDQSGMFCDEYEQQESRIKVIHTKNNGLVTARKIGVTASIGDYVGFVDSDDYIDKITYQSMYDMTENGTVDMVGCGCVVEKHHKISYQGMNQASPGVYEKDRLEKLKHHMMFDIQLGIPSVFQSVCCKLLKKSLLMKILESIDSEITIGEDAAVVYPFLLQAKKVVLSDQCFYHYVIRENSMTHSKDYFIFEKIYRFQKYMLECYKDYDASYMLEMQLNRYLLHLIDMGMENLFGIRYKKEKRVQLPSRLNGKRIILYGAGEAGRRYYLDILKNQKINIIAWVDKNLAQKRIYNITIQEPEIIKNREFDCILITVADKKVAKEIKEELIQVCDSKKVLWFPGCIQYSGEIEFLNEMLK